MTTARIQQRAFSLKTAAATLGVSYNTLYDLAKSGQLRTISVGGAIRITDDEFRRQGWPLPIDHGAPIRSR